MRTAGREALCEYRALADQERSLEPACPRQVCSKAVAQRTGGGVLGWFGSKYSPLDGTPNALFANAMAPDDAATGAGTGRRFPATGMPGTVP